ncbi:hypothetical protein BK718_17520 [Bacillus thuringiensis serovar andalousiensis]|nr:hypothetical protein BK718_17520 [Bacillus thuringiensis serovar andalousiensis]
MNYLSFFLQVRNIFEKTVYKAENYYFLRDSIEEFFICTVLYGTRFPYRFHLQFIVFSLPFTKLKWNKFITYVNVKINMYIFACLSMYKINHFLC